MAVLLLPLSFERLRQALYGARPDCPNRPGRGYRADLTWRYRPLHASHDDAVSRAETGSAGRTLSRRPSGIPAGGRSLDFAYRTAAASRARRFGCRTAAESGSGRDSRADAGLRPHRSAWQDRAMV